MSMYKTNLLMLQANSRATRTLRLFTRPSKKGNRLHLECKLCLQSTKIKSKYQLSNSCTKHLGPNPGRIKTFVTAWTVSLSLRGQIWQYLNSNCLTICSTSSFLQLGNSMYITCLLQRRRSVDSCWQKPSLRKLPSRFLTLSTCRINRNKKRWLL